MYNRQLETFITVSDAGSFNKAAEELFITPTAVIKQINSLENSLGLKLFERTHRGLSLTKAGMSLYSDSKYIVNYCKDSITRAKNAMSEGENIIRIGSSPMTPAQLLIKLWSKIQKKCPELKFEIIPFENTPENAREILANLGQKIDIVGGIFDDTMLSLRKCSGLELEKETFCCAVSLHHRLAQKDKLQISDLYNENLMLINRGWSKQIDALRDEILTNHPKISITNFEFYDMNIFNLCESGNNILLVVPTWENVHPLLKVIPVEWNYGISYGLMHSPNPSPKVQRVLDATKSSTDKDYNIKP